MILPIRGDVLDVSKGGSLLDGVPLSERHEEGEERETSRKNEGFLSSKAPSYVKESGKRRRAAPEEVKGRVARCVIARKCWSCGQGDHVARDC